jgi:hypothetical protein
MSLRIGLGIAAALLVPVSGIWTTLLMTSIVDEVNRLRPPDKRFTPYGWWFGKYVDVLAAYRKSVPGGRKHVQFRWVTALGIVALLVAAACFGILPGTELH